MTQLPYVMTMDTALFANMSFMLSCLGLLATSVFAMILIGNSLNEQFGGPDAIPGDFNIPVRKYISFGKVFMPLYTVLCLLIYGPGMEVLRSIIFCGTLLYISYYDNQTHELDHYNFAVLLAASLIGQEWDTNLLFNVGSSFLIAIVIAFVTAVLRVNLGFGGADALLIATAGASMSVYPSLIAVVIGLAVFVGYRLIRDHGIDRSKPFAVGPFLCVGFLIMNLLNFLF